MVLCLEGGWYTGSDAMKCMKQEGTRSGNNMPLPMPPTWPFNPTDSFDIYPAEPSLSTV